MAAPQSAIQNTPTTSYIYVNSLDRYSNGFPPSAGSNQTTCTDITFPLPGLSNIATVQVSSISLVSSWWNQVGLNAFSSAFYTNIINLVDLTTSTTYLITVPEGTTSLTSMVSNLGKYVQASAFGGSAAGSQSFTTAAAANGSYPTYDPVGSPGSFWIWGDTSRSTGQHSFGWSRVTTAPDGTNIANRRQLFDILGLAGHVPSVAGVSGVQGAGYTVTQLGNQITSGTSPIRFVDMISPQLTNFAPDVNSCSAASSNAIGRFLQPTLSSLGFVTASTFAKVMKVAPGSTSLRIQLVDDQQNPLPTNFPIQAPYQGTRIAGIGILSTTLSNVTLSGISNANVTFPAGTQININYVSGTVPAGWYYGVYQVQSSTSNTITIPYLTTSANQISNANYGFSIYPTWINSTAGNQNGPEYQLTLTAIARTTQ